MDQSYHVYSDASLRANMAVAVRIIAPNGEATNRSMTCEVTRSTNAEIVGYCIGLAMTPVGSAVVLHYDVDHLPKLLAREASMPGRKHALRKHALVHEVNKLRVLMAERSVTLMRATGTHYRHCHREARKAAGLAPSPKTEPSQKTELSELKQAAPKKGSQIGASQEEIMAWAKQLGEAKRRKKGPRPYRGTDPELLKITRFPQYHTYY